MSHVFSSVEGFIDIYNPKSMFIANYWTKFGKKDYWIGVFKSPELYKKLFLICFPFICVGITNKRGYIIGIGISIILSYILMCIYLWTHCLYIKAKTHYKKVSQLSIAFPLLIIIMFGVMIVGKFIPNPVAKIILSGPIVPIISGFVAVFAVYNPMLRFGNFCVKNE
jgi:hypothetical protein